MSVLGKLSKKHGALNTSVWLLKQSRKTFSSENELPPMDHFLANIGMKNTTAETKDPASPKLDQIEHATTVEDKKPKSFATLLRNSGFIHLGQMKNSYVVGKIMEVQDNNAYVDFGGKFYFVCEIPEFNNAEYRRGRLVSVILKDFELSARFLGASKDTTLLEASGYIVGLLREKQAKPREESESFNQLDENLTQLNPV